MHQYSKLYNELKTELERTDIERIFKKVDDNMKINIFYSWQSDLSSDKNRNLIEHCLKKAINMLKREIPEVSEISLESDSRNDIGTPDLTESIFGKIERCDILIADISLINAGCRYRLTPNPNVLLEVGFAAKAISWSNILCIYNKEYGNVELLPFDIRTRKPIVYNTFEGVPKAKEVLTAALKSQIKDIIYNRVIDKKEYLSTKQNVDLALQSILFDLCDVVFGNDSSDRYSYNKLLHMSKESLTTLLSKKQFVGFFLFRNIETNIEEFTNFFNDSLETFFLNEKEKRILAKLVFALKSYRQILRSEKILNCVKSSSEYVIQSGREMNTKNPENSYLLLKPINDSEAIVIAGGVFESVLPKTMIDIFELTEEALSIFVNQINEIIVLVNDWITITGKYFMFNPKLLEERR